jgi:hypothetical protein
VGSEFLKTVFDALLAMASCDGELHEDEVEVLEAFKVEFSNELKSEGGLDCVLLKADVCFESLRRALHGLLVTDGRSSNSYS